MVHNKFTPICECCEHLAVTDSGQDINLVQIPLPVELNSNIKCALAIKVYAYV